MIARTASPAAGLLVALALVGGCSSGSATGDEHAQEAAAAAGAGEQVEPADSCDWLALAPGTTVPGPALGSCVIDRVLAAGSGRIATHYEGWSDLLDGRGEFTTVPEHSVSFSTNGGLTGVVLVGDRAWANDGLGWVAADPAGDLRAMGAAQTASVLRATADPQANVDFISMFNTWDVTGAQQVTQPDGSTVEGVGITARGEADLQGTRVSQASFVLDEQFRPVLSRAASTQAGFGTVFGNLTYFGWGDPVTITAPA